MPSRLPTWSDYTKEKRTGNPSAETAIRFLVVYQSQPYLTIRFDQTASWVKTQYADPQNPFLWKQSEQLLHHEQGHFLLNCLLARQANQVIRNTDDPQKMLRLVQAVAQRLNLQYDRDTHHGVNTKAQEAWEAEIQRQFQEVSRPSPDHHLGIFNVQ